MAVGLHASQGVDDGNSGAPRDSPRQQFRLVESSPPLPPPVQRHRHDGVEALVARQRVRAEIRASGPASGRIPAVFVKVDQLRAARLRTRRSNRPHQNREGRCGTDAQRPSASSGKPFWNGVLQLLQKNSASSGCGSCRHWGQTGTRVICVQRPAADAAIIGKEQGKKGVRGCADCRETETGDCGSDATREDPPPLSFHCT